MVVFGSRRRSGARGRFAALQVLILLASIAVPAVALAATVPHFDVAPSHLPSTGSHTVTALVRNTATAAGDTARCIRVTTPAGFSVTSATYVVANPGTT